MSEFTDAITKAYAVEGAAIDLGRGVLGDETDQAAAVRVPLAMMNRHGLVAGATGTGKTVTLQVMAEQLSAAGVPVFIADVKGDVSGVSVAGASGALGIGEAAVTILSENGVPTPVVHCKMVAPASRMGPADDVDGTAKASQLCGKYGTRAEADSAGELLTARLDAATVAAEAPAGDGGAPSDAPLAKAEAKGSVDAGVDAGVGGVEAIGDFLNSGQGKAMQREVVRGIFGMLRKKF